MEPSKKSKTNSCTSAERMRKLRDPDSVFKASCLHQPRWRVYDGKYEHCLNCNGFRFMSPDLDFDEGWEWEEPKDSKL